jgi:hypothetical protein
MQRGEEMPVGWMIGRDGKPLTDPKRAEQGLLLEQAERVKQRLPLLEIHADVLEACVRQGEGDLDNSAVIKEIRRRMRP